MNSGKKEKTQTSIRFSGVGGMGVILSSIILGKAAIYDNKNAVQTQSYGAEQRGSKVKSDILISDLDDPSYPVFDKVDILVAFSQEAYDYYVTSTKKKSLLLINSDLIEKTSIKRNRFNISATSIAEELLSKKITNVVMLGALIKLSKIVSRESILKAIVESVPKSYVDVNVKAFERGYDFFQDN
ncbi:MAG: hypothetical protein GF317_03070 [Candidatus Lokiarchaeota archaeon]|nr:hypothetical protein [Candidatus Lokiarchaeota archaeon]MBD3198889.1 hypothetical protein [Candidatus Lokiarchaeota archaeon]